MDIEYYGANCFRIKTKGSSIVIDDNLEAIGAKSVTKDKDVVVYTSEMLKDKKALSKARLVLDSAGEYEVGDVSVKALQTRAHMDEEGVETATVYQFLYENMSVIILGHIHPDLSDDVIEMAGGTDVLVVPVGGNGYTLDVVGATNVIKKIEPDAVVPSQYAIKGLNYEVLANPLDEFMKTSGMQSAEPIDSYKVGKSSAELSGQTHLVLINAK
jgi:L-ascorbate metabolism protein UlaG (beta-lactamase superfamily)